MTEDNNSINETIETVETPVKKTRKKKVEILTECRVLKGFRLSHGPVVRKFNKNADGQYITHKVETKSGAIRHERTINIISLNLDDMKEALKLKAVEVV